MAKTKNVRRPKSLDRQYMGDEPDWTGAEGWKPDEVYRQKRHAHYWYSYFYTGKDMKKHLIKWAQVNGYDETDVKVLKAVKDSRFIVTYGAVAKMLMAGMPENENESKWLHSKIADLMKQSDRVDLLEDDSEEQEEAKPEAPKPNIQARTKQVALSIAEPFEMLEEAGIISGAPDLKDFDALKTLRNKSAAAGHCRKLLDVYEPLLEEMKLAVAGTDDQVKEGYSHLTKRQLNTWVKFYQNIVDSCNMIIDEGKAKRAPRKKKAKSAAKQVERIKYQEKDDKLKLVSQNPQQIPGAKEVWIYHTKYRKLGKYVAEEHGELGVKGTTITGYDEEKSVCKTVRKPEQVLKEFPLGKIKARKFLEDINSVPHKLKSRTNEHTIILQVIK